ncbi:phosphotransferase [Clostridium gasigenes]|uniref:phosphotransferase n=1 Tax=Clostridium gasigenes TaxID=94869 RepID=UPI001C0B868A|nr:phosphotransferase [Clostridium gasigenes]MBU3138152.1 phosphotransferase [Clostridium gasigenes]
MKNIFKLLKEINKKPGINQRALSINSEMSLGKVNALVEDLEFNRFVTREKNGREHRYFINDKGLEFLESELKLSQDTHLELHKDKNVLPSKAVVLVAGRNKSFNKPIGLVDVNGEKLIDRTIKQLKNSGIKDIILVVGYQADIFKEKLSKDIIVVENKDYKWTGTMASLAVAAPYIDRDFILVEGDIVIEDIGISETIKYPKRDCVLITQESGSGDEGFVEIKDDYIYKISKDIAQLNKIDGEMIGISKISYEFYVKMIDAYKYNKNPYMNYEYMMLDISKQYSLGYVKIDNLLWHEIDTVEHHKFVEKKLLSKILRKEESLKLYNLREIVCNVMNVEDSSIKDISPIGGMTNKNYKVLINEEAYVLRVPGNGTEEMISRVDEIKTAVYANEIGVDAELIYFNEDTGMKVSKFIDNAETLTADAAKKQHNMSLVCEILRTLHTSTKEMENDFDIYGKIEKYEKLLEKSKGNNFEDYLIVKNQILDLKIIMKDLNMNLTPCHNDTLASNFIKSGQDRMYLIDWEYGGMNDPMWDLSSYCLENEFSEDEEELFLNIYFEGDIEDKYKTRILINKIYQDFLWSIWTNIKEASGDDFGSYGIDRYNRAKSNLSIVLEGKR